MKGKGKERLEEGENYKTALFPSHSSRLGSGGLFSSGISISFLFSPSLFPFLFFFFLFEKKKKKEQQPTYIYIISTPFSKPFFPTEIGCCLGKIACKSRRSFFSFFFFPLNFPIFFFFFGPFSFSFSFSFLFFFFILFNHPSSSLPLTFFFFFSFFI